jgi:hypothetical protein
MRNIAKLDLYLNTFKELIDQLKEKENNVVIGGMQALTLHGLNFSRETQDLDLIIYNPTPNQSIALQALKIFQVTRENMQVSYGEIQKSNKFRKDNLFIDILIEVGQKPEGLLNHINGEMQLPVQSVKNVIAAKASYKYEGVGGFYVREKDLLDFIDLKNSNFNK